MKKQQRRKDQILQEMAGIERMEKGRLTAEFRESTQDGKVVKRGPYYKHQCWDQGHNLSRRVPAKDAPDLQEAVEGYHHFKQLSEEYADLTIEMTRTQAGVPKGKKSQIEPVPKGWISRLMKSE